MPGQFERFRVHEIDVSRRYGEDNTVWFGDILGDQVASLLLDIGRLVANGNLAELEESPEKVPRLHTLVKPGKSTSVKLRT